MSNEIMLYQLSNDELIQKMKRSFTDVTCFFTRETAEQAIHDNIQHNAEIISEWLFNDNPYASQRLRIQHEHSKPIGYGVHWKIHKRIDNISQSYIILEKTQFEEYEEGFYIIFAAPFVNVGGIL